MQRAALKRKRLFGWKNKHVASSSLSRDGNCNSIKHIFHNPNAGGATANEENLPNPRRRKSGKFEWRKKRKPFHFSLPYSLRVGLYHAPPSIICSLRQWRRRDKVLKLRFTATESCVCFGWLPGWPGGFCCNIKYFSFFVVGIHVLFEALCSHHLLDYRLRIELIEDLKF